MNWKFWQKKNIEEDEKKPYKIGYRIGYYVGDERYTYTSFSIEGVGNYAKEIERYKSIVIDLYNQLESDKKFLATKDNLLVISKESFIDAYIITSEEE